MKCLLLLSVLAIATAVEYHILNNAGGDIWIGIQGNPDFEHLEQGGFVLGQGEEKVVNSPDNWNGRFWARTYCDPDTNYCKTGDCGNKLECQGAGGVPPATLLEITQQGETGENFYDISLVDGFNIQASFKPVNGEGNCTELSCETDINQLCPDDEKLRVMDGDTVIACKSACMGYDTDEYCCRGEFNDSNKCNPENGSWEVNTSKLFKDACPDAYSFAYNDKNSLFTCKANRYDITFG